jgi:chromosome segregation ATPase
MAITSKAMDKDLKDYRIETLENQVKDLQKIKQDLQNKLLNSEKSIIEKNSQIKVSSCLMDSYSKKIRELEFELKDKESEIDKLNNRIKSLKFTVLTNMVIVLTVICMLMYYYFK